jgi:hypothetical protein
MIFLIGLTYVLLVYLTPYLYTLFSKDKASVFVPINNQHFQCGDSRIYGACVNETRLNFFKHKHPCSDKKGAMAIDLLRFNTYRLVNLLGFGLKDFRYSYLLAFSMSLIIQYSLLFLITDHLLGNEVLACIFSLVTLFFNRVIHVLDNKKPISALKGYFLSNVLNVGSNSIQDNISDNLRFVITGTSNIFLWGSILIALYIGEFHSVYHIAGISIYLVSLLLVYPPTALLSLVVVCFSIILTIISLGEYDLLWIFGLSSIIVLLLSFSKTLRNSFLLILNSENQVLEESHSSSNKLSLLVRIKNLIFSYVTLLSFLILLVNWFFELHQLILIVTMSIWSFHFLGYTVNKSVLVHRFYERGFSDALFYSLVISFYIFFHSIIKSDSFDLAINAITILMLGLLLIGCFKMAKAQLLGKAYQIPKEEWELYQYIKENVEVRSEILTFDYSSLQLIPVYTHANLFVCGAEWLKDPYEEVSKFAYFYNKYKGDQSSFIKLIDSYFSRKEGFTCSPGKKESTDHMSAYHLINTLIYIPHVKTFNKKIIFNNAFDAWTDEFIEELKLIGKKVFDESSPNLVLFKKSEFNIRHLVDPIETVFENNSYLLCKLKDEIT